MKQLLAFPLLLLLSPFLHADPGSDAQKYNEARLKGDFAVAVAYTYPKFVESKGGPDKMMADLKTARERIAAMGVEMPATSLGSSGQVVTAGSRKYALVPAVTTMITPRGKALIKGYFLAISEDSGSSWKFIDLTAPASSPQGDPAEYVRRFIPDFPSDFVFPPKELPKME